jgi:hypothetical protein
LVEHQLPKLRVASSNLVSRSLLNSHLDESLGGCFALDIPSPTNTATSFGVPGAALAY